MKPFQCISLLILFSFPLTGQVPVGTWSDHLRYNTSENLAPAKNKIYSSTGSALLVYEEEFNELKKLSTVNGLSETGISYIAWSEDTETLIIGYKSTNIDLLSKSTIYNFPEIRDKYIPEPKRINRISSSGDNAYLATSFGIVVLDLVKKEIRDTWKPGPDADPNEVFDVVLTENKIFAATDKGVWFADASAQGLSYFGNWHQVTDLPQPDSRYNCVLFSGSRLYVNLSPESGEGDFIYGIDDETELILSTPGVTNHSFDPAPGGFLVSSGNNLRYFNSDGSLKVTITSYGWGNPEIVQAVVKNNDFWIADLNHGLIKGENLALFSAFTLEGPADDRVSDINYGAGRIIICPGGADETWSQLNRPFQVSVYENNGFEILTSPTTVDATVSCIDHLRSNRLFVATWGDGLLEYEGNSLSRQYDALNTPQLALNSGDNGVRIAGLAMDEESNLWIAQSGIYGTLKILKHDGGWIVNPAEIDAAILGDLISTSNGMKWIVLPVNNALFILDDKKTPEVFADDTYRKLTIKDSDGNIINSVCSIAEDLDGNIWIGTGEGPVIYYNPSRIFDSDVRAGRIKVPRNDGSGLADYLLGTETITSIAVDGANRKWLGTKNSGVYLISADGNSTLKNYNTKNSPLFSDSITSVEVDQKTGEVWIGTSLGTLSVREIATSGGEDFIKVYAFPNPVREDFNGSVTITGLIRDTYVKITDISGNLVYETISEGGQAVWDLRTYEGRRAATGVYIAFCSAADGTRSTVVKILVIGR